MSFTDCMCKKWYTEYFVNDLFFINNTSKKMTLVLKKSLSLAENINKFNKYANYVSNYSISILVIFWPFSVY